jgi:ATP-dependent Clp protease ATP-binding subunit ClpX
MYEVPSLDDVGECIITGEVVRERVNPTLVPRAEAERRKRSA